MEQEIKKMDLNEFLKDGFLQEANRRFFHPLGLALEVNIDDDGNVTGLGGLWDYREDPEGILFANIDVEKIKKVEELRKSKIEKRKEEGCDKNGIQWSLKLSHE